LSAGPRNATAPVKVLFVAAEVAPFVKVGGLADVAGALPKALCAMGHDVRVVMPLYRQIDRNARGVRRTNASAIAVPGSDAPAELYESKMGAVTVYLIASNRFFDRDGVYGFPDDTERFLYFCWAALSVLDAVDWEPEVIHCNDWHTAVIPYWLRTRRDLPQRARASASLLTIHNLAYQGAFDPGKLGPPWVDPATLRKRGDGGADLMSQGIQFADLISTVSEQYAHEITTPEFGEGLDGLLTSRQNQLRGILNGIDYETFDPARDPHIAMNYSADDVRGKAACKAALQREMGFDVNPRTPVVALIGRLADQKGFDLVAEVLEPLTAEANVQVVVLGTGDQRYHDLFRVLASHNRARIAVNLTFDEALAQRIYAGADAFLMPSRFEPCGLGQMIALRYGTVPIVRATGGLADTVQDYQPSTQRGTGFVFRRYDATALTFAVGRALEVYRDAERWRGIQERGMRQDFSWGASAARYVEAYRDACALRRQDPSPVPRGMGG